MKNILFVLGGITLALISASFADAQTILIDSLKKSLQQHPQQDSVAVHIYSRLAEELKGFDNEKAAGYARNALGIAVKIKNPTSMAEAFFMMGRIYAIMESTDSARYYFNTALTISRQHHLDEWEGRICSEFGVMEYMSGNYDEALKILLTGIPIAERMNHKSLLAGMYTNTAGIFFQQEEYEKALRYELKSYKLFLQSPDRRICGVIANIGQEYGALGMTDSAFYYMHMAVAEAARWNDSTEIGYGYACLGDQFKEGENGNADSALWYYQKGLSIFDMINYNDPLIGEMYGAIGEIMLAKKQFKEALSNLKTSEKILVTANYLDQLSNTYKVMAEAYHAVGDKESAYLYLEKYATLHDTLTAIAKTNATAELERKFSLSQKEKEIELLNKDKKIQQEEARQQRLLKNIFIGGAVLLLLLAFLLLNRFLLKQRTAKQLEEKNKLIEKEKLRAEQSEKFKSQFLANMSHEIRTPMNAISGFTALLFDEEDEAKRLQYLTAIKKSSDNLLVVINDVLDLSKLEAGKMQLERIPFRIQDSLNFIYETFQSRVEQKRVSWNVDTDGNVPPVVFGDPSRLAQVLMNLAGNAMKFTDHGSITLSAAPSETNPGSITFKIVDTGSGIPSQQLSHIFESFNQAHLSDNRKFGGTGLGLTISRNLIELMHGKLEVQSEEGKGSVFSFTIPLEEATEEEWNSHRKDELFYEEDLGETLRGCSILIVEDNEYNQLLISDTLKKFIPDVHITIAANGEEALSLLRQGDFRNSNADSLILMDIQMPGLDGYATTRVIRNEMKNNIPIIALTASVIRSDIDKGFQAGMNAYVPKPFSAKELLKCMVQLLGREHAAEPQHTQPYRPHEAVKNESPKFRGIQLDHLRNIVHGDENQFTRYLNLFNELIPARMIILKEANSIHDFVSVRKTVHAMKPQLISLGLFDAKKLAENIESNFHREERIPAWVEELLLQCDAALEEVRRELGVIL